MRIHHAALSVLELDAARDFFVRYFGGGYYESCIRGIEGSLIEITV